MRRRDLMLLLAGAMTAAPALRAQQKTMPVIGFLATGSPSFYGPLYVAAFQQALSDAGYVEGKNVRIEYRWADRSLDRLPALAADLVGRSVDVIVTQGAPAIRAAKAATTTIPIVFTGANDPVAAGFVASLSRPGGNITGPSLMETELMAKRLELLSELVPQARVIALLVNPNNPTTERMIRDVQEAVRTKGLQLAVVKASTEAEIEAAFATLVQRQANALLIGADAFFSSRHEQLAVLTARYAIPAIFQWREFATAGGLASYGSSNIGHWRQAGIYAGKILKGAKPSDLPVEQPTRFELVVNLKTAKTLGLTIPQTILQLADEVIE